tara:strand:- start:903 stop:1106 length:204 start_codon:yes stop_codon:yes gene_type:complete
MEIEESKMKVGDLVTLKDHCKNSGRLAVVTETSPDSWRLNCVKIIYPDTCELINEFEENLEVIYEGG